MSSLPSRIAPPQTFDGLFFGTALDHAIDTFAKVVVRSRTIDHVLFEIIRLRCAGYHDCRFCMSARTTAAVDTGLDEDLIAQIARYETSGFDGRTKVALRFVDAIIQQPTDLTAQLRRDLLAHFTEAELAEIALAVIKWSQQKVLVALRIDTPPWESGVKVTWDAEQPGNAHIDDTVNLPPQR